MNMLNYSVLLHDWKRPFCWERLRTGGEAATEDEMVGWHHRFNGHESVQTLEMVRDREAWRAAGHGVTNGYN